MFGQLVRGVRVVLSGPGTHSPTRLRRIPVRPRSLPLFQAAGALLLIAGLITAFGFTGSAHATGTGPGASGNTIPGAAAAQPPFTPNTPFDSGQPLDVVVPANSVLTPGATIFILECAAPNGVDPTTINSCDGNTGYAGGTVSVNSDGSIDLIKSSSASGQPYPVYALPDSFTLAENPNSPTKCGLGAANECVLYIGQGGGSDVGLSQPHFFSQAFQVHTDPTDSGTSSPGDGSASQGTSVSPTLSTVGPATQSATADGKDPATVTVTLNDTNSAPVMGKTVSLTGSGAATVAPASSGSNVTDANGQATFAVTDATAETVTLHAADTTDSVAVTQTAQATFATPTVNQAVSGVTASPTQVPNDGSTASTITVKLLDNSVHGQPAPLANRSITLASLSGSSVISPSTSGSDVTNSSGLATFSVTDLVNEVVTYKATDTTDSLTLTNTTSVQFGVAPPVSATKSTITANPTAPQTGIGAGTQITVTLLAADGTTPIIGKTVTLGVTGTTANIAGGPTAPSNSSGQAVFQVTDTVPETVTVSATDTTDTVPLQATLQVTFSTPPPPTISASLSTVTLSSSTGLADGQTPVIVDVTVFNTNSQAMPNVAVTVATNPSTTTTVDPVASGGTAPGTTDATGQASFQVRDTKAETVTFTATAGSVALSSQPTATFAAGSPDANQSTVAANPANVAADGHASSTVTVTLTDHFGNPVQGRTISVAGLAGHSTVTPTATGAGNTPGTTNAQGVATFGVTDATNEVVTYSATDTSDSLILSQLASVTFGTPPPVVPAQGDSSAVVNNAKVVADGKTAAIVTVTLRDANGSPVSGKTVSLTPSAGSSVVTAAPAPTATIVVTPNAASSRATSASPTVTTDSNGIAAFDVTDTVPESVTYAATDTTDSMTGWSVGITFTAATASATSGTTPSSTATTAPSSSGTGGAGTTGAAGSGSGGSGSGSGAGGSTPNLAFTGASLALPWMFGLGALLLLLGTLGRRLVTVKARGR